MKVVFDRDTILGSLDIKIDGVVVTNLNQYGATRQWQQEWVSGALTAGDHKLELIHASGSVVNVDAVEVQ